MGNMCVDYASAVVAASAFPSSTRVVLAVGFREPTVATPDTRVAASFLPNSGPAVSNPRIVAGNASSYENGTVRQGESC